MAIIIARSLMSIISQKGSLYTTGVVIILPLLGEKNSAFMLYLHREALERSGLGSNSR